MDYDKEISFGAFDSELMHQEIFIPEGFTATIDGNKIILKKIESEDERIRKAIIELVRQSSEILGMQNQSNMIAWLEKHGQEPRKVSIWKHWKDGICGNGEGKLIYLIKNGDAYSLSSSLGYECDYIELSELDNLMLKQGEQKPSDEEMKEALRTEYEKGRADVIAQMQKKWSEEDYAMIEAAINLAHEYGRHGLWVWLKSIKQRYTWKPSDEQMEVLVWCLPLFVDPKSKGILESLIKELKKLREE